jgi:outer membrane protein TolC
MRTLTTLTTLSLTLFAAHAASAGTLSVDEYLQQVRTQGPAFRSAQSAAEGLSKQRVQADLIYSPMLIMHGQRTDDRKEQSMPEFFGTRTVNDHYGAMLNKKWSFGPSTSLGYTWMHTDIQGSPFIPAPYWDAMPSASVSVPLLKDFGGSQTKAQMEKMRSQIDAWAFQALSGRDQVIYGSRMAYAVLALSRAEVETRKDTMARTEKVVAWAERRARRNLGDDAEPLQARAMRQVRELELQAAIEKERNARLEFNRLRGEASDKVDDEVQGVEALVGSLVFDWPKETPTRFDLKAAEAQARAARASWKDAKANVWPDVTAFAQATGNGQDAAFPPAHADAMRFDHPTYVLGVQAVIPLDVPTAFKAAEGYEKNYQGALSDIQAKRLEVDQDWKRLNEHLSDVNRRLEMMGAIVKIQKEKAEMERTRLSEGRTTQFQLQSFETDYSEARLNYLGLLMEKLSVWAEGERFLSAQRAYKKGPEGGRP